MIHVLIVEDSPSAAQLLGHILSSDPGICISGVATNGEDALCKLARITVDVVTMDINLPGMNGFETTRRIMETKPVPIVIVSSLVGHSTDASNPFRVMEEGALALLSKPPGPGHPEYEKRAKELIRTASPIRRWKEDGLNWEPSAPGITLLRLDMWPKYSMKRLPGRWDCGRIR